MSRGFTYFEDYEREVLKKASSQVIGGVEDRNHRSTIYQQWLQNKSTGEAASKIRSYYWQGH